MAKVSELPLAAHLDGEESVVFVQNGETRRGPVAHIDRLIAGGSRFRNLPSFGYYRGAAVVDAVLDPQGRLTAHATRTATYVRAVDPTATVLSGNRFRNLPSIGYIDGAAVTAAVLDPQGRATSVQKRGERALVAPPMPTYIGDGEGVGVTADGRICYLLIITGQSLAEGNSTPIQPVLSAVPRYPGHALMLEPAVRLRTRVGLNKPAPPATPIGMKLVDLIEAADAETFVWETAASSWANHLIRMVEDKTGAPIRVAAMVAAMGATSLAQLKRGSTTYGWLMRGVQDWADACRRQGLRPVVLAHNFCQGESDVTNLTEAADYGAGLIRYERETGADFRAITGQTEMIPMIVDAPQIVRSDVLPFDHNIVLAHDIAASNPDIVLGSSLYELPRSMGEEIHPSAVGQVRRGINLARIAFRHCFDGGFSPLAPTRWEKVDTTHIAVHFPRPVMFAGADEDVDATGLPGYRGMIFTDRSSGATIPIIDHLWSGDSKTLTLTLSAPATGLSWRLAYALAGNDSDDRPGPRFGPRGLLRAINGAIVPPAGWPDADHTNYEWVRPFILQF
ncbi:MAG: hypothetical protein V4523_05020 [Pseudomonadota bacterium]